MTERTSSAIMAELMADASDRRRDTLSRLKAACDDLKGDTRLRLSDIERCIAERFGCEWGPRAQTISNEKTLPLGMHHYVEARRREAGRRPIAARRVGSDPTNGNYIRSRIEKITDPDTRDLMRDVYGMFLLEKATCGRLTHVLRTTRPGVDIDKVAAGEPIVSETLIDSRSAEVLRRMRAILTNEEKLSACGLAVSNGSVRRKGKLGDELFSAGLLDDFFALCKNLDQQ